MACLYWLNHAYAEPTPDSGKCLLAVGGKKEKKKKAKEELVIIKISPLLISLPLHALLP